MHIHRKAERHIAKSDPVMAALIKRVGHCEMRHEAEPWVALASSILGQQISVHAARAIRGRFAALAPGRAFPNPADVLRFPDELMRGAGLSGNKVRSVRDLARHFDEGLIDPTHFDAMDDEEIIGALVPVRGIGRWTAEMFLLFSLQRPDVLAVDDLGLRNAMQRLYNLDEVPKPAVMRAIAEAWRPHRSVASWYLWRSLDNEPKIAK